MQLCPGSTGLLFLVLVLVLCFSLCSIVVSPQPTLKQNELVFRFKQNALTIECSDLLVVFLITFERLFLHFAVFRDSRRYFVSACGSFWKIVCKNRGNSVCVCGKPNPPLPPSTSLLTDAQPGRALMGPDDHMIPQTGHQVSGRVAVQLYSTTRGPGASG